MRNHQSHLIALIVGLLIGVGVLGVGAQQTEAQTPSAPSECSAAVFTAEWERSAIDVLAGLQYTAAVFDTETSCWYELNSDLTLTTASAIKLQILAANLDRVEQLGRPLSNTEIAAAQRMLWFSHNSPPTSQLYVLAGTSAMSVFSDAVGATTIQHTPIYGITTTTAADLTKSSLATLNLDVSSPLTVQSRSVARDLLADVHFTQRWGIIAGVPDDHDVWLKNGFFPCTSCGPFSGTYTWRLASTGYVERPNGSGWAITVLTDGAQSQEQGMAAVEAIAKQVSSALSDGEPGASPLGEANCVTVSSGESTTSITSRLGLPITAWDDIRWVSGNEGPLRGQLMCAPEPFVNVSACLCPARKTTKK